MKKPLEISPLQYSIAFKSACLVVLAQCPNEYAKSYARAGLKLDNNGARALQCPYILSNITHWRGDAARDVRNAFKALATACITYV